MPYSTAGESVVWDEWVDVVRKRKREKLESKFVEHKGALDNQPYNAKQLVDNMNKNKALKQILIQGKNEQSQKKRTLLEKKFAPHNSETTSLHQLDETSLKGNVKERNAMIIELNDKRFYIIFAQFKQQQKEMDRNTVETITVRTDQSKRKIVIRIPTENAAQCFDVACEFAMAKMGYTIGLFSQCLYLQFPSKELARWMQKLTVGDLGGLKRAARYLVRTSSMPTRCSTWISKTL